MSGGLWNYQNDSLQSEIFGYGEKPCNALEDKVISELVWDVFELLHAYDWYRSGDTCKEDYDRVRAKFKKKWLKDDPERTKRIVDEAMDSLKKELYDTFCFKEDTE
jgi:hypothetical protein